MTHAAAEDQPSESQETTMKLHHSPDASPSRGALMMATLLCTSGLTGTLLLGAAVTLPAYGAERAVAVSGKKPKPTATSTTTATATSTPTAPTTNSAPPTDTSTPSSSAVDPTVSVEPSPSATGTATPEPTTNCVDVTAVAFEGNLYCPGEIAGVEAGAYGVGSRVVLSVTVTGVEGDLVSIMGGPECWHDPSTTEPMYCAATVGSMVVDFSGSQLPTPSTQIALFGVTQPGGIRPDGFVTVAWCDPDYCP